MQSPTYAAAVNNKADGLAHIKNLTFNGPAMAIARTLTAMSTLLTIVFTPTSQLFAPSEGRENPIQCDSKLGRANPFCIGDDSSPTIGIAASIIILSLVIVGVVPWITSLLHFYIAFYLQQSLAIPDGGDQVAVFLTLMIAIVYLGDLRLNHWSMVTRTVPWQPYTTIVGLYLIKCQMTVIYLNASIHKMATKDWLEGSELYYILGGSFEPYGFLNSLYEIVVDQPFLSVAATWGAALTELFLGATILMPTHWKKISFVIGAAFHIGIAAFLGITSFQIVMIAGLLILCLPIDSGWLDGSKTLTQFSFKKRVSNSREVSVS
ncbi:sporulation-delaying protein SdpB family protein [Corynebacterium variabile]|uniref:sporulation-delaying protein SdpB family protein n=1 Tax=Corynebacterium variabile TaxID=1727 RepID=UPI003FD052FC